MDRAELIILAGGGSSRMGTDKLRLRDSAGNLLLRQWFERLKWPTLPWLILPPDGRAPDDIADWSVAHDAVAGEGPLRGVATALAATDADWLLIVAVDTPGIGRTQLDWLLDQRATDPAARLWMCRRPTGIEPFPLLVHRDLASAVGERVLANRRSVHGLSDEAHARIIDAPGDWPAEVWRNLNRPEDLREYLTT